MIKLSHSTRTPPKKRFKVLSDSEIALKRRQLVNQNTLMAEKNVDTAFKDFLLEIGFEFTEYHLFEEEDLN